MHTTRNETTYPSTISNSDHLEGFVKSSENRFLKTSQKIEDFAETLDEMKPLLRGWLHLCTAPVVLGAGLLVLSFAPTAISRVSIAIFLFFSIQLFAVSALYHRTNGVIKPEYTKILRSMDHASIPLLIGASTTPFAILLLEGSSRMWLLTLIWSLVVITSISRFFMHKIPKWVNAPAYFVLGWIPVMFIPDFVEGAGRLGEGVSNAVMILVVIGGVLYTIGGVVFFGLRPGWSNCWSRVWGYHEWWHLATVLAYMCHFIAVTLMAYNL